MAKERTLFDLSESGIEKAIKLADRSGVHINAFTADINRFRLDTEFDIIYSNGVLHYIPPELRNEIFANYKKFTAANGINMHSAFVKKPFIGPAPDTEKYTYKWISGELFTYYNDWLINLCEEEVFECMSSGIPHKHAMNRVMARNTNNNGSIAK